MRSLVCAATAALTFALAISISSSTAQTTLRLGIQPELPSLPVIIAAERGFLVARAKEAGLGQVTVTLQKLSGAAAVNEALMRLRKRRPGQMGLRRATREADDRAPRVWIPVR